MSAVHNEYNSNPSSPPLGIAWEALMEKKYKNKMFFNFKNPSNPAEIQRIKEFLENATDSYLPMSLVGTCRHGCGRTDGRGFWAGSLSWCRGG